MATAKIPSDHKRKSTTSRISSVQSWKQSSGIEDLPVPSGNVARVRRVGPEAFLSSGMVPDALSPIIDEAIRDKQGLAPSKIAEMMTDDGGALPAMIDMMNRIVAYAVIEPHVEVPPDCVAQITKGKGNRAKKELCGKSESHESHQDRGDNQHDFIEGRIIDGEIVLGRDGDLLYSDEVSLDDRIFIMNFAVGGTRDLETFHQEHEQSMASVAAEQNLELPAK
jgi:hypothetical protein